MYFCVVGMSLLPLFTLVFIVFWNSSDSVVFFVHRAISRICVCHFSYLRVKQWTVKCAISRICVLNNGP
jgi:hypothetical protein